MLLVSPTTMRAVSLYLGVSCRAVLLSLLPSPSWLMRLIVQSTVATPEDLADCLADRGVRAALINLLPGPRTGLGVGGVDGEEVSAVVSSRALRTDVQ